MDDGNRTILLKEDDGNDVPLVPHARRNRGIDALIHVVWNGGRAIKDFAGMGKCANPNQYPIPAIVPPDLTLPKRSDLEVLEWLKDHERFALPPVVAFTHSTVITFVSMAYLPGEGSYLKKPYTFAAMTGLLKVVSPYWLGHNKHPSTCARSYGE